MNTVNCVGIMGKGIAQQFKKQYPEMFEDYVDRCKSKEVEEGIPYLFRDLFGNMILNFPTKGHWKNLTNMQKVSTGLDYFIQHYKEWGIKSIAFPPLGCGNGGLTWEQIGPLMYQKLSSLDIPIEIYAPWGTPEEQLTPEFLQSTPDTDIRAKRISDEIPSGWFAILEIVYRLERLKYSLSIGSTVFQKICYIATLSGLQTGFTFKKGQYGPFSADIQKAYLILGRENLIKVENVQNHQQVSTGDKYQTSRDSILKKIHCHEDEIQRIVDLFSRINSAVQAEEIGTILYALDELSADNKDLVSEISFYDYVLSWKKQWSTDEKHLSVANTIRELAAMNWIRLDYSAELPVENEGDQFDESIQSNPLF
ncbi:MAG: macro domain-containing protein [Candidatus Cloacimonetes bacterium]|nr:macro domain-containing protein [Candidatus Cloacimonadota bacterium]MCK9183982.1 macro domain-containing protein [Candidatus Cloacimonadota bacterium]MCK9583860.1 macro domain-containing protein [Candidatus Cloacimonadota bacterium]